MVLAVTLSTRSLRSELVSDMDVERLGSVRELRLLAEYYGLSTSGREEDLRRRILVHLWRERREEGTLREDRVGREVLERAAPATSPRRLGRSKASRRRLLSQLVHEGRGLQALSAMCNLDHHPYLRVLVEVREAAVSGNLETASEILRIGNEQLRARLEDVVARDPVIAHRISLRQGGDRGRLGGALSPDS